MILIKYGRLQIDIATHSCRVIIGYYSWKAYSYKPTNRKNQSIFPIKIYGTNRQVGTIEMKVTFSRHDEQQNFANQKGARL